MSDNRGIVYHDPKLDAWIYRASSVGKSLRCLSAARQGYDPLPAPDYLIAAAEAGNRYEIIVKARLRDSGYRISGEQGEIDYYVFDGVYIRGHLDGAHCFAPDDPTDRMLEVKSMSERVFKTWMLHGFDRFPEYAAQLSIYMHAEAQRRGLDEPVEATYAVVNRETDELDIRTVKHPPADISVITQKVMLSEQFAKLDQLPACDSASQYMCPFDYACDKHEILFEEIEAGTEAAFVKLGKDYVTVLEQEKVVAAEKEALRSEIRKALGVRDELKVPGFSFTNKAPKPTKKPNLVRIRAFFEKHEEDFDTYMDETQPGPVLRITPTKET